MDHVTSYLITAQEICTLASFRLAARQKVRLSLIIGHAVALLVARAFLPRALRRPQGRPGDLPMSGEPSYWELAGAFARILRETPRLEDAIRVFDAQRVRLLALRDLALDEVVREVAAVFGTTPAVLLSAHLGRQVADARAVLAQILAIRGWSVERLAGILGEDPDIVRAMTDVVTRHPSLMTLMRLALESASAPSEGFPEHSSTVGSAPNPTPSPISESGDALRTCRDG